MPKQALTEVGVRALKPPPCGQVTYWDTNSPLGVRVSQGGSKTFIVMVRSGERRTLGRVGIVGLSDARSEAKRLIAQKTLGYLEPRVALKFQTARDLFVEQHYLDKRPRSKKEAKQLLEKHFVRLDNRPLADITAGDISKELDKLSKTPGERLHAFRVGRTFFRWCTRPPRCYIKHSPLKGYEPPGKDGKNERVLSQEELKKVWQSAQGSFGAIIRLLILTTARKMEIGSMRYEWLEDNVLTIPGEVRKNHKSLTLPLGPLALEIIASQPHLNGFVFPGRKENTHIHDGSFAKLKIQLDGASGVTDYGLHSLRKTAATMMARETPPHILQAILGHSDGPVSELQSLYNKYEYLEEKRDALRSWEERIQSLCPGAL